MVKVCVHCFVCNCKVNQLEEGCICCYCCRVCHVHCQFIVTLEPFSQIWICDSCLNQSNSELTVSAIHTAAIEMLAGKESGNHSRKPEIVADAAYAIFSKDSKSITGKYLIDEDVLKEAGVTNLAQYAVNPANADNLMPDFFLDVAPDQIKADMKITGGTRESGGSSDADIEKIFSAITKNLNPDLVKNTQAVFLFNVTGSKSGTWFVDLKNGDGSAGKGNPSNTPDSTLTMNSKDFLNMFMGKLKPTTAFMSGKLKISGNLQKAMKLEKLMGALKSKI